MQAESPAEPMCAVPFVPSQGRPRVRNCPLLRYLDAACNTALRCPACRHTSDRIFPYSCLIMAVCNQFPSVLRELVQAD